MQAHYATGQGILTPSASGDLAGIFCRARIPLRDTLNVGNGPAWLANTTRPDLVHQCLWVLYQQDDSLSRAVTQAKSPYHPSAEVMVEGAPKLDILRRSANDNDTVH